MAIYTALPEELSEVDVIIAGGGTTGCVVAARLAEADPGLSILVIEAGANNDIPPVSVPALFLVNLMPTSTTNMFYQTNKEKQLGDRKLIVPSGSVLGGGSSTNLMMYSRAQRSDFDSWGVPGWSAEKMVPYLRKLETYHGPGAKDTHGSSGPIHVSSGTYRALKSENDFIQAAEKVGWNEIEDLSSLDANNGVQRAMRYISPDGKRQDAASRYLHPRLQDGKHPNLHVLLETKIVRVLFDRDNKKAGGVEYIPKSGAPGNDESAANKSPPVQKAKARKLVIVSCGALGTPPILERSGIGSPEILQRAGIPIVAEIPGVGHEYEDHQLLVYPYKSSLSPEETIDAIASGRRNVEELLKNSDKILGWNTQDITCKLRPSETDIAGIGPEFQNIWKRDYANNPNKPLVLMSLINGFPGDPSSIPAGQYVGISVFTVYPYSRGHLHITGPSPSDPLDFSTGFFSDPDDIDIKKHMWAYKKQREIARRMHTYRGEVVSGHPPFPPTSKAACIDNVTQHDPDSIQDIEYTVEDDAILATWLRANVGTTWHSVGTCKMAPLANNGVVDDELRVYGVEALRIADLSILPHNVAANTNNTALVVGEKAADIFIEELRLK